MKTLFKQIGSDVLDLIYPPGLYCISCGKIIDDTRAYRLCNDCMAAMNWNTDRHCGKCGRPLSDNNPGTLCFMCASYMSTGELVSEDLNDSASKRRGSRDTTILPDHTRAFDKGYACAGYGAVEQSVIFALKYAGQCDIGDTLGEILYDRMAAEYDVDELSGMYDIVLPVPIYTEKKKKRGYNHADLMAAAFAKRAGLRYASNVLKRTRPTLPMKGLGPEERKANIAGAFAVRDRMLPLLSGARVLLVDDIFTTGATIDEIASLLKDNSAARVDFLTFAAAADMVM